MNLPVSLKMVILNEYIFELLNNPNHGKILYENYRRCYNNWSKDNNNQENASFKSKYDYLLDNQTEEINLIY